MKNILYNISHYGDILAIPFFALSIVYFYNITNRNNIENILFLFSIFGFTLDIVYTYLFFQK